MEHDPNPYEPPQTASDPPREGSSLAEPREGWKYALLAVAILLGLASFVPWLAVILGIASAPVFLRYYRRHSAASGSAGLAGRAIGTVGMTFLGIAVLASASGAFLGTCSAASWGLGLSGVFQPLARSINSEVYLLDLLISIGVGAAIGLVPGVLTCVWLVRRIRRAP